MDWEIRPRIGGGPVNFGMTPDQVAAVLGPPASRRDLSNGDVREFWRLESKRYDIIVQYRDRTTTQVIFPFSGSPVHIQGTYLFRDDPATVVSSMSAMNGSDCKTFDDEDVMYFDNLCIILHDIMLDEHTNKGVVVVAPDAFAELLAKK